MQLYRRIQGSLSIKLKVSFHSCEASFKSCELSLSICVKCISFHMKSVFVQRLSIHAKFLSRHSKSHSFMWSLHCWEVYFHLWRDPASMMASINAHEVYGRTPLERPVYQKWSWPYGRWILMQMVLKNYSGNLYISQVRIGVGISLGFQPREIHTILQLYIVFVYHCHTDNVETLLVCGDIWWIRVATWYLFRLTRREAFAPVSTLDVEFISPALHWCCCLGPSLW